MSKIPNYLTVKRVVETEECYVVKDAKGLTSAKMVAGLENGDLNIMQVATCEPLAWLVNKNGKRLASLEKDGGCGPSEVVTIAGDTLNKV
jgi:hypothetical protein